MTLRFTALAGAAILALATAMPAAAQYSSQESDHDALIREMMEDDGAYVGQDPNMQNPYGQNPYGQTQNPYGQPQSPYGQNPYPQPGSDPCSIYQNYITPACQNRQVSQNPYGQNPYGQPQNPSTAYNPGGNNPFGQPSASISGAQSVQVMDTQNPQGRPIVAFTRQIPAGWQSSGRINWQENGMRMCGLMTPNVNWTARSPNGQEQMQLWPEEIFSGATGPYSQGTTGGCPQTSVADNRAFLTAFVKSKRPGARIVNVVEPTRAEYQQLQSAMPPISLNVPDMQSRTEINTAKININYTENGRSYDEILFPARITLHLKGTGMMQGNNMHMTTIIPTFSMRAPSGQLSEARAITFMDAHMPNPAHQQMTKAYQDKKAQDNAKAMIAASKNRMRNNQMPSRPAGSSNPVGDIIAAGGPESGRSSTLQNRTIDSIRGVNTYNDPMSMTGTVEGNTGNGQYMYRTNDGSYVQTDDPFYNQGTQLDPNE